MNSKMSFIVSLVSLPTLIMAIRRCECHSKGLDAHPEDSRPFRDAQQRLYGIPEVRPIRFTGALGLETVLTLLS
jgi:hypothetical protein